MKLTKRNYWNKTSLLNIINNHNLSNKIRMKKYKQIMKFGNCIECVPVGFNIIQSNTSNNENVNKFKSSSNNKTKNTNISM